MNLFGIQLSKGQLLLLLAGLLGLAGIVAFDKFYWGIYAFAEGPPDFSSGRVVRSIFIFLSCLFLLAAFLQRDRRFSLGTWQENKLAYTGVTAGLGFSLIFTLLLLLNPPLFSSATLEDGPIEWGSALFLFAACIACVVAFLLNVKQSAIPVFTKLSLLVLGAVFFVMGMEEVSWFQRVLEIETPQAFENNLQREINLHNFATNYVENAYYFGAFVYLVVFPYLRLMHPDMLRIKYFKCFVARPYIALIGAMALTYNYDMWNIIFMQIAFWSGLIILSGYYLSAAGVLEKRMAALWLLLLLSGQWIYLSNGNHYARVWEVTEYREFLMPLAFFIYSLDLLGQLKKTYLVHND